MAIKESPDSLHLPNRGELWYSDEDAAPFGYKGGKFFLGKKGDTHVDIGHNQTPKIHTSRDNMKFPGRVWVNRKIFSLWLYPKTATEWKRLIADLSKAINHDVKNDFSVELAKAWGTDNEERSNEKVISIKKLMDKIEKKGKRLKIPQHSIDTQNIKHLKSPVVKGIQYIPPGLGSKKRVAGLTATQYHQKRMTSDSIIKLKPIILEILVEQMILKESIGNLPTYFAIGPDGKLIKCGEKDIHYHGDSVKLYPKIYKQALDMYGSERKLENAIADGQEDLYKIMYDNGIVRGGKNVSNNTIWVAFNPKKVSSKPLMMVLQILKEKGIKKLDVDSRYKYESELSADEFIEKYL